MPKSVGICRTLFLAFLSIILDNNNLSIGANALTYIIDYFLPPLLLGVLVSRKEAIYGVSANSNITV